MLAAPEPAVRLDDHFVGSAEVIEVVDVLRAEVDLQRVEHVGRREPDLLGHQSVDVSIDRRRPSIEQCEHASEARVLVGCSHKCVGGVHEGLCAQSSAVLQHHLETTGIADALHRRRRDRQHVGVLDHRQALAQIRQHRTRGDPPDVMIVERRQPREDRAGIGRDRERRRIQPRKWRDMLHARRLQDDVHCALHHLLRALKAGAGWKLQDGDEIALVLLGNEAGWLAGKFEPGCSDQPDIDHHDDRKGADQPPGQRAVGIRELLEPAIEAAESDGPIADHRPARRCIWSRSFSCATDLGLG